MADKILIVDDDMAICKLMDKVMRSSGMETVIVNRGRDALSLISRTSFDLILLDVMLGDIEGFDVVKKIRSDGVQTPIIIVSGRNEDYDSLYGLSLGADDYVTKPFRPLVLGAKVQALIRRNKSLSMKEGDVIHRGPFMYDTNTMRFFKNGEELQLSSREGAIFALFMKHPGQIYTKEMLYEQVWNSSFGIDDNSIMVYINRLRSKIEDDHKNPQHIITVRGVGYRFVP